jgi:hypothetical protein
LSPKSPRLRANKGNRPNSGESGYSFATDFWDSCVSVFQRIPISWKQFVTPAAGLRSTKWSNGPISFKTPIPQEFAMSAFKLSTLFCAAAVLMASTHSVQAAEAFQSPVAGQSGGQFTSDIDTSEEIMDAEVNLSRDVQLMGMLPYIEQDNLYGGYTLDLYGYSWTIDAQTLGIIAVLVGL